MSHSTTIGGSNAARAIACPASIDLAQKYPNKSSSYAEEGTAMHWALEQLLNEAASSPALLVGQTSENGIEITQDHVNEKIIPALAAWNEICTKYGVEEFVTEAKVTYTDDLEGCHGTADVLAITKAGRMLMLDWKFGSGVMVSPVENKQLMFYAGAVKETPEYADMFRPEADLIIVQPPVWGAWATTAEALDDLACDLVDALADRKTMAAGDHCRFCPVKPECPAHIESARHAVIQPIVDEKLPELLELALRAEIWAKSVFEHAYTQVESGVVVPGWKLVQKQGRRGWTDEEEVVRLLKNRRLTNPEIFDEKLKSPAQIEKVLQAKGKSATFIADLAPTRSSGTTLAPESDKREAVNVDLPNLKELNQ